MSKFIDELNRSYRFSAPSIGFRRDSDMLKKAPILLIADLTGMNVKEVKAIVGAGVDAVMVRSSGTNSDAIGKFTKNIGETPLGLLLEDESPEKYSEFLNSSCDFVICHVKAPISLLIRGELGKILMIEPWIAPGMIRAINELNMTIDGIFIDSENSSITVERLLICHHIAGILGKPLLSAVNIPLTGTDLQGLYDARVRGLLLPRDISVEALVELKDHVSKMPGTTHRKTRDHVLLPQVGNETEIEVEEEEEDI